MSDASIAMDPVTPSKLIAVASYNPTDTANFRAGIRYWYSTNAGATWSNPVTINNLDDPTQFNTNTILNQFVRNENANVVIDRLLS